GSGGVAGGWGAGRAWGGLPALAFREWTGGGTVAGLASGRPGSMGTGRRRSEGATSLALTGTTFGSSGLAAGGAVGGGTRLTGTWAAGGSESDLRSPGSGGGAGTTTGVGTGFDGPTGGAGVFSFGSTAIPSLSAGNWAGGGTGAGASGAFAGAGAVAGTTGAAFSSAGGVAARPVITPWYRITIPTCA